jgi:hypothetical protein
VRGKKKEGGEGIKDDVNKVVCGYTKNEPIET